jgi:putative aldouronate transport system substrate-binding protein
MKKRTLALLLALAMVLAVLAGCGGTSSTAGTEETKAPTTDEQEATAAPDEATAEPDADPKANFPLAEEEVTYTWFMPAPSAIGTSITTYNENSVISYMAELTNVDWDFISPPQELAKEQFNIVVNSGDVPDVIMNFSQYYSGGYDTAFEEEIVQPLNDYVPKYMPYYQAFLDEYPQYDKFVHTDSGNLWGIGSITVVQPAEWGPMIRQDWLDQVGLDTPTTLDDWETVLTAFKDQLGKEGMLILLNTGYPDFFGNSYAVTGAFGVTGLGTDQGAPGFINDNGTAVFTVQEQGYKDYLSLMADWFSKGLINRDFTSINQMNFTEYLTTDQAGIFCWNWQEQESFEALIGGDADIEPIPNPVLNEGDELHLYNHNEPTSGTCVSAALNEEDLRIVLGYFDYFWSDEGFILKNFGVQGEAWDYDENGEPAYTELIYANENPNWSVSVTIDTFTLNNGVGQGYILGRLAMPTISESARSCDSIWSNDAAYYFPSVTLTSDESSEASHIMAEIKTYVSEYTLAAIAGEKDIDATWDEYLATLQAFNVDKLIEIYQAALDRYMSR